MHGLPYEYEWRKVTADCFCCVGAECALWVLLLLGINTQYDDEYTHPPVPEVDAVPVEMYVRYLWYQVPV